MELFERIAQHILYGRTPAEIHDAFIGQYSNEVIYLNWMAARQLLRRWAKEEMTRQIAV